MIQLTLDELRIIPFIREIYPKLIAKEFCNFEELSDYEKQVKTAIEEGNIEEILRLSEIK